MPFTCVVASNFSANRSEKREKFSPEPLANDTIDVQVQTGVDDNEDIVEIIHAEPDGGQPCCTGSPVNNIIIIVNTLM